MDRLERLLDLTATLLAAERALTRDELLERVPGYPPDPASARRAFERDKDALRGMGQPLVVEGVAGDETEAQLGYRVRREEYELPDPGLSEDEVAALHLAVSTVRLDGGAAGAEALWKLGGSGPGGADQIDVPAASAALPGSEHLPALFAAVAERRRVAFSYGGVARTVDPWRLSCQRGRWYLTGFDHGREDDRLFRLDRVAGPVTTQGGAAAFAPPPASGPGTPPPAWQMGDEPPVTVHLLVDAGHASWAEGNSYGGEPVERRPDGAVVLRYTVRNVAAFRSFVLGFLDHAEVIGPESVRVDMVAWLSRLAAPAERADAQPAR